MNEESTTPAHLTSAQISTLLTGIKAHRVSKDGKGFSHVEAYEIRAHLIRCFGFCRWDAAADVMEMIFETPSDGDKPKWTVAYRAKVTLRVRAEDGTLLATYSEWATGDAQNQPGRADAHDLAIKGLALDTPIPTPSGWSSMGDLRVGDTVFDRDGERCRVIGVSEVKHLPCYEVLFVNGDSIVCDDEHVWVATVAQEREKAQFVGRLHAAKVAGKSVRVPVQGALDLPPADLPMDPYVFGLWLGDGCRSEARVTANVKDIDHYEAALRTAGIQPGRRQPSPGAVTVSMLGQRKVLAEMGSLGEKSIPAAYLRGSIAQRRALLAGLLDSDGTSSRNRVIFTAKREAHARAVAELASSLGERVRLSSGMRSGFGVTGTYWFVEWSPVNNPFALPRKAEKIRPRHKPAYNTIRSITPVDSVPTQCIAVDSPSRTYLAGETMVPTHNTAESQALKRCAVNLGDQFGLSLYRKGSLEPQVKMLVGQSPGDAQAAAPAGYAPAEDRTGPEPAEVRPDLTARLRLERVVSEARALAGARDKVGLAKLTVQAGKERLMDREVQAFDPETGGEAGTVRLRALLDRLTKEATA